MVLVHVRDGKKLFDEQLLLDIKNKQHDDVLRILDNVVQVKDLVDSSGKTLLHHAAEIGDQLIVDYLIDRGCDVDARDSDGNTPLLCACGSNNRETITALLFEDADMLLSNYANDASALKWILSPEVSSPSSPLSSNFHFGISFARDAMRDKFSWDSRKMAKFLMDLECHPLPRAIYFEDPLIIEYMLEAGCDVHDRDDEGSTALHWAVRSGDAESMKILLRHGADIQAVDKHGCPPSRKYRTGRSGNDEVLKLLLDNDSSLNSPTPEGYEFAASVLAHGRPNEVKLLLDYGVFDLVDNTWDDCGRNLLYYVSFMNKHPDALEQVDGREFDVNAIDGLGRTALWYAVAYDNSRVLEFLLKHGADLNIQSPNQHSVLFGIFWEEQAQCRPESSLECLELLLEYGADVTCKDVKGHTLFHHFSRLGVKLELVRMIIAHLATLKIMGRYTKDFIVKLLGDPRYQKLFTIYTRKVERLRTTMVNGRFSLLQFLTESDEKLLMYARNQVSMQTLEMICSNDRRSNLFIKRLRKRLQSVRRISDLQSIAVSMIFEIMDSDNLLIAERIVLLLDHRSLVNLAQV